MFYAEADYHFYLEKRQMACDKHERKIYAYVLKGNPVYFLITPTLERVLSYALKKTWRTRTPPPLSLGPPVFDRYARKCLISLVLRLKRAPTRGSSAAFDWVVLSSKP